MGEGTVGFNVQEEIAALKNRIATLELARPMTPLTTITPHYVCVCPAGAEAGCSSPVCPRHALLDGTLIAVGAARVHVTGEPEIQADERQPDRDVLRPLGRPRPQGGEETLLVAFALLNHLPDFGLVEPSQLLDRKLEDVDGARGGYHPLPRQVHRSRGHHAAPVVAAIDGLQT